MVYDYRDKNKPSQECLYGWFPGPSGAAIRQNPKDVYINLGVRPPKDQSYTEAELIYQYHQSLKASQRANAHAPHQTPEQAVKPPWSLNVMKISNQLEQQELEEKQIKEFEQRYEVIKNFNRTKSAPVPTHRIILKIPHAQLTNVYDTEGELKASTTAVENQKIAKTTNDTISNKSNSSSKYNYVDVSTYHLEDQRLPTPTHGQSIAEHTGNNFLQVRGNATTLEAPYQIRPKTTIVNQRRSSIASNGSSNSQNEPDNQKPDNESEEYISNDNKHNTSYKAGPGVTLHFSNQKILSDLIKQTQLKEEAPNNNSSKPPLPPSTGTEKKIEFLRAHQNTGREGKQSPSKPTYHCKVIEAETFGNKEQEVYSHTVFVSNSITGKVQTEKVRPKTTSVKQQRPNSRGSVRPYTSKSRGNKPVCTSDQEDSEPHYTISDYHRELQLASPDKKPITQTSSQIELAQKYAQKLYNLNIEQDPSADNQRFNELPEPLSKAEVKIAEGHWKDQVLSREKFLHRRPKYNVKIDPEKVKSDPPAPEYFFNAPETFFYNTSPSRKATFTINPHFRSEVLNVQKLGLKNREHASSPNLFGAPVKYRRNYAFVY